jgi:hypothetical protein
MRISWTHATREESMLTDFRAPISGAAILVDRTAVPIADEIQG